MTETELAHRATHSQDGVRHTLEIEIPAETMAQRIDAVARAYRERVRLPGFRKGKAPLAMVRQQYAEEIRERVLDRIIPEYVTRELQARGLEPLAAPELAGVEFPPNGPLSFTVRFDTAPEVTVKESRFRVRRPHVQVTDEMVQQALEELRDRAARLVPVQEGAVVADGSYARCRIVLLPRDGKGKKLAEEDRFVHVGAERAIPGLNEQLPGLRVGEQREFVTELASSFPNALLAGKEVLCRVRVEELKQRQLPELDDDLAREVGVDSLAVLRERVAEDLRRRLEREADQAVDEQLLEQLRQANPVPVPDSLIERRLEQMARRLARGLAEQGIDPRGMIDWQAFRREQRGAAADGVAEEMLLDRIAEQEGIEVDDEAVREEIVRQLGEREGGNPRPAAPVIQQMRKDGSFEALRLSLRRRRALEALRARATIEPDGGDQTASETTPE